MNIRQAKDYIRDSISVYLKKDEYGDYRIPIIRQRPIFLLGAPGIGKTAIMEQVAQELHIALVSYSMTHHTRQSALGLPFISRRSYNGMEYDVSEYTMSEIIASIYDTMEESKVTEGILFLDEINCVSETLAPSMLQFLQYKVFGRHRVPDGWVIVTAGNPPEYNKSVREFDVVTMDRLKVIRVEADYEAWKQYACDKGIHSAILSFLETKKDYFYHMETLSGGRSYVTARGWEDLSDIIHMYEEDKLRIDEELVGQYLQNPKIVREFCAYYDLYNKYKSDYRVDEILEGNITDASIKKAGSAAFDERLSLLAMLLDYVKAELKQSVEASDYLADVVKILKDIRSRSAKSEEAGVVTQEVKIYIENKEDAMKKLERANSLSLSDKKRYRRVIEFLRRCSSEAELVSADNNIQFDTLSKLYNKELGFVKSEVEKAKLHLHNMFLFAGRAFTDGNELLVLVTELTVDTHCARFIGTFGSEDYTHYNELLMVSERQNRMRDELKKLNLFD